MTSMKSDNLVLVPDPRLRETAAPIKLLTRSKIKRIHGMLDIMKESGGIGLAAPQIGWTVRAFVMNVTGKTEDDLIFINPTLEAFGQIILYREGCLSIPGVYGNVLRPEGVRVRALDLTGKSFIMEASGLAARCAQHEFDHLSGVLFTDKVEPDAAD